MHWTATLRDQTLPRSARVAAELPCIECGYNLFRADPRGKCPECGRLVSESIAAAAQPRALSDRLRRMAPTWLVVLITPLLLTYWAGSWLALAGALAIAFVAGWRAGSIAMLRRRGELSICPEAAGAAGIWFIAAVAHAATAAGMLIVATVGIGVAAPGWVDDLFGGLFFVFLAVVIAELAVTAWVGRCMLPVFDYTLLRFEANAIIAMCLLVPTIAAIGGGIAWLAEGTFGFGVGVGVFILLCAGGFMVTMAMILLFHLSNAADRMREDEEDLLEAAP